MWTRWALPAQRALGGLMLTLPLAVAREPAPELPPVCRVGAIDEIGLPTSCAQLPSGVALPEGDDPPLVHPDGVALWRFPRRVLFVGGSSMQHGLGPAIGDALQSAGVPAVAIRARYATGLARLDFFDWIEAAELLGETDDIDLVVAMFAGNDAQGLRAPSGRLVAGWNSPDWAPVYAARVAQVVSRLSRRGAHVVVLGYPHPTQRPLEGRMAEINEVTRAAATEAGAAFVPLWDLTSTPDGSPRDTWPSPSGPRPLRQDDGVHLAPGADAWVAQRVAERILALLEPVDQCEAPASPPPRLAKVPVPAWPPTAAELAAAAEAEGAGEAGGAPAVPAPRPGG